MRCVCMLCLFNFIYYGFWGKSNPKIKVLRLRYWVWVFQWNMLLTAIFSRQSVIRNRLCFESSLSNLDYTLHLSVCMVYSISLLAKQEDISLPLEILISLGSWEVAAYTVNHARQTQPVMSCKCSCDSLLVGFGWVMWFDNSTGMYTEGTSKLHLIKEYHTGYKMYSKYSI